jgi:ABC-type transporter MlaC component
MLKHCSLSRRHFLGALLLSTTAGVPASAAVDAAAESYAKSIMKDFIGLSAGSAPPEVLRQKFSILLAKHVNMKGVANFALGTYQSKLLPAQQAAFYALVNNYAAALFTWYAKDFRGQGLKVISTTKQGDFTLVHGAIQNGSLGGEQVRLRLTGTAGNFRVADFNVKNVWMAIAMKQRFGDILRKSKGDFAPLLAELKSADNWWS